MGFDLLYDVRILVKQSAISPNPMVYLVRRCIAHMLSAFSVEVVQPISKSSGKYLDIFVHYC